MTTITITSQSISAANGGFSGFNDRLVIPTANLDQTYAGQGSISVTLKSFSTESGTLDEIWIGHQGAGNVYNFDGNQVQLKFAGSVSKALSGAVTFTTDLANFNYIPTKPLIVSTHWSGTTDTGQSIAGPTNCNQYFSGASQAGTTSPTGVWSQDSTWTWVSSISLNEAQFIGSLVELPLKPDYRVVLADSTEPICPILRGNVPVYGWEWDHAKWDSGQWSSVPSTLAQSLQRDLPLARDYSVALAATMPPVGPLQRGNVLPTDVGSPGVRRNPNYRTAVMDTSQPAGPIFVPIAPPVNFFPRIQELPRVRDFGAVLAATTQPVLTTSFRTAVTPAAFFSASLQDDRPMRPDYSRAIQDTTQPVCQISFRTAVTPSISSNLSLQDDRPMARDYRVQLADTTLSVWPVGPPATATVTPTTYFNMSLQDDRPIARDYRVALADTTKPVVTMFPPAAPPAQTLVDAPVSTIPFRRDYLTGAQVATTAPVWPQAPPGPAQTPTFFFSASLQDDRPLRPDYLRVLYDTTKPVVPYAFRTAVTPLTYSNLFLQDDRPMRPDPSRALEVTTRPALIVQPPPPAQTPTYQFNLSLQDDRAIARDYRTSLASTTRTVGPALQPTLTPSVQFNLSLLDDRPQVRDYRVALASTTVPYAPLFQPAPPPQQNLVGIPESVLPGRADYSRTLAPTIPTVLFEPCFNVGYTIIPTAGAGNSFTAGYVFGNGPYTMPQTGVVTSCSVWLDTGPLGTFRLGIYGAVSNTQPGSLLASTAPFTPQAGWNTQPVLFPTTVAGGTSVFMGTLNTGGSSPTKADPTVGINLYGDSGTNSVMDPVFQNPAILDATSFQLGAYATFCPAAPLTSNWFQTPYQANPIAKDYRIVLGDAQPTQTLTAVLPPPPTATPTYLGIAISGEVPTGGDYRAALASTVEPRSAIYAPPIAFPNQLFLNSLGVTTHMSQGYSEANYEPMFAYTGIRISRDGANVANLLITLHNNTVTNTYPGVKALIGGANPPSGETVPGNLLDAAGALFGFEGPNEPNNFTFTYNGVVTGDAVSWFQVGQFQSDLYQTVRSNTAFNKYPVFGVSEAGAEFDNVGLQYNTIPAGAGALFPDGTVFQDYANIHNYVLGTSSTYAAGRPTVSFSIGNLPGGIDGRKGEYVGTTWSKHFPAYSTQDGATVPFVTTETGADTGGASLTQDQQGKLYVNVYLAGFQAQMATGQKLAFTGIYEMVDQQGSTDNKGFYTTGNVAKKSADYLHNMTTVLADIGPDPIPRSLDFTVVGETAFCHHFLLQKSDSTFYLILWGEEIVGGPTHSVTVNFKSTWNVNVYDVTTGTAPVSALSAVTTVPLTIQDHAQILQITPLVSDAGPPQARVTNYRTAVLATTSPVGSELLPTPSPQILYYPGGIPRDNPLSPDYRVALMSTTFPRGPELLPTSSLPGIALWVPNPDSTMPDWW